MAKKRAPKYKQLQSKFRTNLGTYISQEDARSIVRSAKGKRLTKSLVSKYFEKKPAVRSTRLRAPSGAFLDKEQEQEIRNAAKQLNIPVKQAAGIYFESRLEITENLFKPLHELERLAEDMLLRNPDLKIKINRGDESRTRLYRGENALAALREASRAIYAEALAEQNRGRAKKDRSSRLDSDRIPIAEITLIRRSGSIVPHTIVFDFTKIASEAELEAEAEMLELLEQELPKPRKAPVKRKKRKAVKIKTKAKR